MSDHRLGSYHVAFDSMEPAIAAGTDVLGDTAYYANNKPARWEVVAFSMGNNPNRFVKRILGLPGETIQFTHKGFMIDGTLVPVPAELRGRFASFSNDNHHKHGAQAFKVPADSVFLVGDNPHLYVTDSRELGPVPIKNLEARILASIQVTPIN
jgi:signal peptidase I